MNDIEYENIRVLRSNAHDVNWLFGFIAGQNTYEMLDSELGDRLDLVNGRSLLKQIIQNSHELYDRLILTYPEPKRRTIEAQRAGLYYHIDVAKPVVESKTHTLVDVELLTIIIENAHETCKLCGHPIRCNTCRLGRALDQCVPEHREKGMSWAEIDVSDKGDM